MEETKYPQQLSCSIQDILLYTPHRTYLNHYILKFSHMLELKVLYIQWRKRLTCLSKFPVFSYQSSVVKKWWNEQKKESVNKKVLQMSSHRVAALFFSIFILQELSTLFLSLYDFSLYFFLQKERNKKSIKFYPSGISSAHLTLVASTKCIFNSNVNKKLCINRGELERSAFPPFPFLS